MLEVNKWDLKLASECDANLVFAKIATVDAYSPELATRAFLLAQRGLKLFLGEQALLKKYLTKSNSLPDFFRISHVIKWF